MTLGPARFDTRTGALVGLGDLTVDDAALGLWRAPTDNDRGVGWDRPDAPSQADQWAALRLDGMVSRLVSLDVAGTALVVRTRVAPPVHDVGVDVTWRWTSDGTSLTGDLTVEPYGPWSCDWARVGLDLTVAAPLEGMAWQGLGPGPRYPDTGQAARRGWWDVGRDELAVRTVRPQEHGARVVQDATVRLGGPAHLRVRGDDLAVTARPWSRRTVAATAHDHELPRTDVAHVSVDAAQHGIGTASCGQGVLEAYRLRPRTVRWQVVLSAVPVGDGGGRADA
ncbi:hypothetical protein [Cellulomonas sp. ATA003]|uniref:hypothetical protein n=1 Tax=Cellulomonas sp. ATA003 TaxID=3073064 RepID=UPI002873B555|nr:hypothetical protein [Cellulomonas sp. ATA003]WNB87071.1 hypothetical protein REH70_08080 [Cellulomonas sp. ATA003]